MMARIELTVKVLTPLHIGTGTALTEGFDYVCHNGKTYRLDLDALAEELYTRDPEFTEMLLRTPPGQLLKPEDLRPDAPYIRYVLPGVPGGQQFREAIKDPRDRPYIPGSSLKGALRTIIAWHAWKELRLSLTHIGLGEKEKRATEDLEAEIFGRDPKKGRHSPHHDLLRALKVSDSTSADTSDLGLYNVQVWTKRGGGAPIAVEAIRPGTEFRFSVGIDDALFSTWAARAEGFPLKRGEWLRDLPRLARERARERAERERDWWGGISGEMVGFFGDVLGALEKTKKGFAVQIGFGTGWEGMTIGAPLKTDPLWPDIYRRYGLGRAPGSRGRTPPDEFPASRRVVVGKDGKPRLPLGWIWVKWEVIR
jgi:CRISPR-associated protein Csm5